MKKNTNKKIIAISLILVVFIIVLFVIISRGSYADSCDKLCEYQKAIISTANAYKYRGYNLQYDDAKMTYNTSNKKNQRSECAFIPEEATDQHIKYASCSPFLWSIYHETFISKSDSGEQYKLGYGTSEITSTSNSNKFVLIANPNSKDNYRKKVAVYNITAYNLDSDENIILNQSPSFSKNNVKIIESIPDKEEKEITYNDSDSFEEYLINQIKNYVQPGDIIGYLYEGGGGSHVVMYIGTDPQNDFKVIHSFNGSSYVYDKKYDYIGKDGAITTWTEASLIKNIFNKNSSQLSIIRPLNEIIDDYDISSNAIARMKYNDLVRSKTASVEEFESVNPGDTITYNIKLQNKSKEILSNIEVSDIIPANTKYLSCTKGCSIQGTNIKWSNVSIGPSSTKIISFTVKVNDNTPLGTIIVSDKTVAADVKLNTIETEVNKTLSKSMQDELKSDALTKINNEYSSTIELLNDVYNKYGISFDKDNNTIDKLFGRFFSSNGTFGEKDLYEFNENVEKRLNNLDYYQKMYIRGLFGGRYVDTKSFDIGNNMACSVSDGRNKTYRDYTFTIGDVILMYDDAVDKEDYVSDKEKDLYLYIGNGEFLTVKNGKVVNIDGKIFRYDKIHSTDEKNFVYNDKTYTIKELKDGKVFFTDSDNNELSRIYYSRLIESLLGQNAFVVLRPSYSINNTIVKDKHDIKIDVIENESGSDLEVFSKSQSFKIRLSDIDGFLKEGTYNIKYAFGYSRSNYTCSSEKMTNKVTIKVNSGVSVAESAPITINTGNYSRIYICNTEKITGTGNSISENTVTVNVMKVDANKPTLGLVPTDKDSNLTNRSQFLKSQKIRFRLYDEYSGLKKGTYIIRYKEYAVNEEVPKCSDMTDFIEINVDKDGTDSIKYSDYITIDKGNFSYIAWCNDEPISDMAGNEKESNSRTYGSDLKVDNTAPKSEIISSTGSSWQKSQTFALKLKDPDGSGLKAGTYTLKYKVYGENEAKPKCSNMTDSINVVVSKDGLQEAISNDVTISKGEYRYIVWCNGTEVSDVVGNTRSIGGIYSSVHDMKVSNTVPDIEAISEYTLKGNFIEGINPKTNISDFSLNLDNRYTVKILDRDDNIKTNGYIGTGYKVQIYLGKDIISEYIVIIKGDVTGDGQIKVSDVAKLYRGFKKKISLADYEIEAGNVVTSDNEIKINDVAKLYRYLKGKDTLD